MDITPLGTEPSSSADPARPQEQPPAGAPSQAPEPTGGLRPRGQAGPSSSPPRQPAPESPMLQALQRGDTDTLRTLYEREAARRPPVEVWQTAGHGKRHDLQHAALVLHPGIQHDLAKTPREKGASGELESFKAELHRPLTSGAHASLVRHVKQFPYYSEKPERNPLADDKFIDHNCKLPFADSPEAIECRHFALAWCLQLDAMGKPDYGILRDKDLIPQHIPYDTQLLVERLNFGAEEAYILPLKDWGAFAAEQLRRLEAGGEAGAKRLVVSSGNHAMAFELKLKPDDEDARYVGNFYDPNRTAGHKRVASNDLRTFEKLALGDLLDAKRMQLYFRGGTAAWLTAVPGGGAAAIPPLKPGGDPQRRMAGELPPLDESVMHFLMAGGFTGNLRDVQPAIAAIAAKDPQQAVRLLKAESKSNSGTPGLYMALQEGQAHVVHAFRDLMDTLALSDRTRSMLLAARAFNGLPGLGGALMFGHAPGPAVRTFVVDILPASGLPHADQLELLEARRSRFDVSGLGRALAAGNVEGMTAYLDGIAAHPGLGEQDRLALLSLQDGDGAPPLAHGLMKDAPAVGGFAAWIAGQGFSAADTRQLLMAECSDGTPGLVQAVQHDAGAGVGAFVTAVLASPMSEADKIHVLSAGEAPGFLLDFAEQMGAGKVVEAYKQAVRHSDLPQPAQDRLLAGH